uniref:HIT domain-containing protein n=2 Tax=Oryza TaxID=4527 RepID=A0A0E0J105_ORYNI
MSPARRLAVLRSHLQPAAPAGEGDRDVVVCAEQAAGVSTSPCSAAAAGGGREAEGKSCVFCRIIRGEAPAFKVYEDDVCLCILDSHPLAPGHSLIIPKCHFPSLEATPPHTHFHIIPRRSGDKLWPTESLRRRSIEPNETSGLVSCIKEQLYSSPEGCKAEPPSSLPKERLEPNQTLADPKLSRAAYRSA